MVQSIIESFLLGLLDFFWCCLIYEISISLSPSFVRAPIDDGMIDEFGRLKSVHCDWVRASLCLFAFDDSMLECTDIKH